METRAGAPSSTSFTVGSRQGGSQGTATDSLSSDNPPRPISAHRKHLLIGSGHAGKDGSLEAMHDFSDLLIPSAQLELPFNKHGMLRVIGTGGFGQVVLGKHVGATVAVKILWHPTEQQQLAFLREAQMLKACRSPYVVLLLGVVTFDGDTEEPPSHLNGFNEDSPSIMLVMEYMQRQDVWRHLHHGNECADYQWYKRGRGIAVHAGRGMAYLHSKNIVHMDIKTQNILLTQTYQAKLADFGLTKLYGPSMNQKMSTVASFTWQYASPEVLVGSDGVVTEKTDIYSYGVVLWELCTGENPFNGISYVDFLQHPQTLREIRVPEEGPQELSDLIRRCLSFDPVERPTALEALDIVLDCAVHKILAQITWRPPNDQ